jgi:hypothetical protein
LISISHYLYRKSRNWAIPVLLAVLSLSVFSPAQLRDRTPKNEPEQPQPKKSTKRGPRAIGVVEFLPGGGARLVPVALWIDGRYYDASLYGANPEPMALERETLYQTTSYGEPTGWFTVTLPKQINGNWVADGKWKTQGALDARLAEQAAKQPKPKHPSAINDDQGPPVLRRSPSSAGDTPSASPPAAPSSTGSSGASSTAPSGNTPPPGSNDDPGRPTLKTPAPSSPADSSRPTLGNDSTATTATPAASQAPATSPDEDDPNRPTLHRGKPSDQPKAGSPEITPAKSSPGKVSKPAAPAAAKNPTAEPGRAYPAVSDAGNYETRPMLYPMTPAEREEKARALLPMAMEEIRNYASKRNAPALPKTSNITDYDVRAFDLDFSNSPTLVLTAKLSLPAATLPGAKQAAGKTKPATVGAAEYFVTLVARLDINTQPIKIFASVTDANHLDAFPRLQIIDAVDADANGRGVLLFRQYSDVSLNYGLYRVFPYQMVKVFEGGAGL